MYAIIKIIIIEIFVQEITSLTNESFVEAFEHLDDLISPRLSQIQDYCQSIDELELERIRKVSCFPLSQNSFSIKNSFQIRDLFKYYSERLYKTHHLSDEDTAVQLEKQANVRLLNSTKEKKSHSTFSRN